MAAWFLRKKEAPLTGAPPVRRQKTYSGDSGYVYQYYFEGSRSVSRRDGPAKEYVFSVLAGRNSWFPASVLLSDATLHAWEQSHGRELQANEQYAVSKMALFQAFDERESPELMHEEIHVRPADLAAILEKLSID